MTRVVESTDYRGAGWVVAVLTHAGRLLRRWRRSRPTMVSMLVMPMAMLVIIKIVFGGMIEQFTGRKVDMTAISVLVCVAMMLTGAITGAGGTVQERHEGIPDRIATLPGSRSAGYCGRILAETIRALVSGGSALGAGLVLGAGFGTLTHAIHVLLALVVVAISSGALAVMMGYLVETPQGAVSFVPLIMSAMFFNTAMMPRELYASSLQPVVDLSPITAVAQVVDDILVDEWSPDHLLLFLAWYIGLAGFSGLVLWLKTGARRR